MTKMRTQSHPEELQCAAILTHCTHLVHRFLLTHRMCRKSFSFHLQTCVQVSEGLKPLHFCHPVML